MNKQISKDEWEAMTPKEQEFTRLCNSLAYYHQKSPVDEFIASHKEFMTDPKNKLVAKRALMISTTAKKYHEFISAFDRMAYEFRDEFVPHYPQGNSEKDFEEHDKLIQNEGEDGRTTLDTFAREYMIL